MPVTPASTLLKMIIKWAKNKDEIRAVILHGSYARKGSTDRLSDIDLCLFTTQPEHFFNREDWFRNFGPVWLSLAPKEQDVMTRKVIYEPDLMVEFTFFPVESLQNMQKSLPDFFEPGYKVLGD